MENQKELNVSLFLDELLVEPSISKYLNELKIKRYNTFIHSLNVGYLTSEIFLNAHSDNVESVAVELEEVKDIVRGALLHDIGKLKVPSTILDKAGRLTDKEAEKIRQHPELGYDIVKDDKNLSDLTKEIILAHHEKVKGDGYPYHKRGKEIPTAVQIVSLCDMYDALTEKRPYRPQKNSYTALQILSRDNIDPDLFLLLARCIKK